MNSTHFRYMLIGFWGILVTVLPFLVSGSLFFPYITGKNIFFRVLVEILVVLWAFSAIYDKSLRPKWGWILGIFSGFVVWVGIADFFGADPLRSFWSNFERMEGYITLLHLFGLFIVSAAVMTKNAWYNIISWSVFISSIVWLHGMAEHFGNNITRIDSGFGNPTYCAAYALIHVFFALVLALRNLQYKYVWGSIAFLNLVTIYFTGTRGALLGVIGGLVVVSILYTIKEWENQKVRNVSLSILGLVIACVIALGLAKNTEFVKTSPSLSRFSELATLDVKGFIENAGRSRTSIWSIAMEGVKERPVLGWGQDVFMQVFSKHYTPAIFDQEQWFDRTHNVFFDWLIAAGIPGLVGYLGIFAALIVFLWKKKDGFTVHEQIFLTGLCVAYFIHTFFVFDSITTYIFIILVWALVHHASVADVSHKNKNEPENSLGLITSAIVVAIIIACFVNIPVYRTGHNLIQGLIYSHGDQRQPVNDALAKQSLIYFKNAIEGSTFAKGEIREQLVDANGRINNSIAGTSTKAAFRNFTSEQLELYADDRPFDARAEFFAGVYFNTIGDFNNGLSHLEAARALSPKKQTILFQVADTYNRLGNKEKSLSVYKEAYELDTTFAEPALRYVEALNANGMKAEAEKVMRSVPDEKLVEMKYVNLLLTANRYDVIAKIFEQALQSNPKDPQIRVSLAAAYVEIGKRTEAIAIIESLAKDFPEAKQQMDYFISEIRAGRNPVEQK